jgi:replicative DNA helicase
MIYNQEAEQYLLGCLLIEPDLIKEISLRPEHFYLGKHRTIFQAMKEAEKNGEPIDIVTVYSNLDKTQRDEIGTGYLSDLSLSVPTTENFKVYEKYILDAWKVRKAKQIAVNLNTGLDMSPDPQLISDAISKLLRLEEIGHDSDYDIKKSLAQLMLDIEKSQVGIKSGYYDLDAFTNGWQDGDLIVVGARPSVGKTAFALNIARNAAKKDVVVSIFSLEMPEKQILKRIISADAWIDASMMRDPKTFFKDEHWEIYSDAIARIEKWPLKIYDNPSTTVQDIRANVRRLKRMYPNKKHLCIIDYLTLIKSEGKESRTVEVGNISRNLKIMARELSLPVITLAQLNRSVETRQDKRPLLSDLRDSGNIEQDADVILFLYRDDYYNPKTEAKNIMEVIIAKQRNGPTGKVILQYLKEYNILLNLR